MQGGVVLFGAWHAVGAGVAHWLRPEGNRRDDLQHAMEALAPRYFVTTEKASHPLAERCDVGDVEILRDRSVAGRLGMSWCCLGGTSRSRTARQRVGFGQCGPTHQLVRLRSAHADRRAQAGLRLQLSAVNEMRRHPACRRTMCSRPGRFGGEATTRALLQSATPLVAGGSAQNERQAPARTRSFSLGGW
jgi:hypothetical protein